MFQTNPKHPLDWMLWPILRFLWEGIFKSRKTSHFWHWKKAVFDSPLTLALHADVKATKITGRLSNFLSTNFMWQEVVILTAITSEPFQIGIRTESDRSGKGTDLICSVVLPSHQKFGMLLGDERVEFLAWTVAEHKFVPLKEVGRATRSTLPTSVPLL